MKKILSKIVDIISIITFMSIVILGAIIGFMVLGSILLGLTVAIFQIEFWIKFGIFIVICIVVILLALLGSNGQGLVEEWRYKRKCKK